MSLPALDMRTVPFSTRGSWLDLSQTIGWHVESDDLHLVSHRNGMHGVLVLRPDDGSPVDWSATPACLTGTTAEGGKVEVAFDGPDVLRLRGEGLVLRLEDASRSLTPHTGTYLFVDPVGGVPVFTSYETGRRCRVTPLAGSCDVVGAEALATARRAVVLGQARGPWEAALEETTTAAPPYTASRSFERVRQDGTAAFIEYVEALAPWRDARTPAVETAAYVLWSATVAPDGFLGRETVLMSKHWMDKVWSWDHCFNAEALAGGLPDLALDQYLVPFDHQDRSGALPDSVSHSEVLRNYVKPPVHGWAWARVRQRLGRDVTRAELRTVHDRLERWTRFWLESRRAPDSVLPFYQHGNDSGWDNATTFDLDRVVESPDLAALLVLQLEVLAGLAEELGLTDAPWKALADTTLEALLDRLWTDDGFVAVGAHTGRPSSTTSLLRLLPIVLAERLPAPVRERLVDDIATHLTEHGLATELPTSPAYESDGYWRGPIWAPSTALIEDGLRRAGHTHLADVVSEQFRRLCERSGFAENFDALSGAGLRDRAYTWTAAVYLTLARDYVARSGPRTNS